MIEADEVNLVTNEWSYDVAVAHVDNSQFGFLYC